MNFEVCFLAGWWEFSYWEGLEVGDSMAAHCDRTAKQHRVHMTISITDMCNMWKIVKNGQTTQTHIGINHRHKNIHNDFDVYSETDTMFSSVWIDMSLAYWLLALHDWPKKMFLSLVNVQLHPQGMHKTWHGMKK